MPGAFAADVASVRGRAEGIIVGLRSPAHFGNRPLDRLLDDLVDLKELRPSERFGALEDVEHSGYMLVRFRKSKIVGPWRRWAGNDRPVGPGDDDRGCSHACPTFHRRRADYPVFFFAFCVSPAQPHRLEAGIPDARKAVGVVDRCLGRFVKRRPLRRVVDRRDCHTIRVTFLSDLDIAHARRQEVREILQVYLIAFEPGPPTH